jgi:hypothetical protein
MKTDTSIPPRTSRTTRFLSALTGLALLATGSPAFAGKADAGDSKVMPAQFHPYGQSFGMYAGWAERMAQLGPVWFLTLPGFSHVPADQQRFANQILSPAKRKFRSGEVHVCENHAMPEMVYLVDLILAHQGASDAFSRDAWGRVQLSIPNNYDVAVLNAVRARWDAEVGALPGSNFDAALWEFKEKLQTVATPAFTISTCHEAFNYFAVPFLPSEAASMDRLQFFINYSQHTYLPPVKATPEFLAAQGLPLDCGAVCCFVDPNYAGQDSYSTLSPRIFGGSSTGGYNWGSTTADPFTVLTNPDTTVDTYGFPSTTFTVYRASGVATFLTLGDTAAVKISYAGRDYGMWKAIIVGGTTATGSRATFRLVSRL